MLKSFLMMSLLTINEVICYRVHLYVVEHESSIIQIKEGFLLINKRWCSYSFELQHLKLRMTLLIPIMTRWTEPLELSNRMHGIKVRLTLESVFLNFLFLCRYPLEHGNFTELAVIYNYEETNFRLVMQLSYLKNYSINIFRMFLFMQLWPFKFSVEYLFRIMRASNYLSIT